MIDGVGNQPESRLAEERADRRTGQKTVHVRSREKKVSDLYRQLKFVREYKGTETEKKDALDSVLKELASLIKNNSDLKPQKEEDRPELNRSETNRMLREIGNADRVSQFFKTPTKIESVSHGQTQSTVIHSRHNKEGQEPTHAIIWCNGFRDASKNNGNIAESIDRIFDGDTSQNRSPSSVVLMSQKGDDKGESAEELLQGLRQKGYKSFSVVSFSGGSAMAQKLLEASSEVAHSTGQKVSDEEHTSLPCKGGMILSPVTAPPKLPKSLSLFQGLVDRLAQPYLVTPQDKDDAKVMTEGRGFFAKQSIGVLYDQRDVYITKRNEGADTGSSQSDDSEGNISRWSDASSYESQVRDAFGDVEISSFSVATEEPKKKRGIAAIMQKAKEYFSSNAPHLNGNKYLFGTVPSYRNLNDDGSDEFVSEKLEKDKIKDRLNPSISSYRSR